MVPCALSPLSYPKCHHLKIGYFILKSWIKKLEIIATMDSAFPERQQSLTSTSLILQLGIVDV